MKNLSLITVLAVFLAGCLSPSFASELKLEPWNGPLLFVSCDWDGAIAFAQNDPRARKVLDADLKQLVRKEVDSILDDWKTKRPWFMKGEGHPYSNQWASPFSALIYGVLCLEDETCRDAYELGVRSLARTAQAMGKDGSCPEGPGYAGRTTEHCFGLPGLQPG